MRAFITGSAGAVAMRKPVVVKMMDIAQNETNRRSFEGRGVVILLGDAKPNVQNGDVECDCF